MTHRQSGIVTAIAFVLMAALVGLSSVACTAAPAPTPEVIVKTVEVPGPQPTPQIIVKTVEIAGPAVTVPTASKDCLDALDRGDTVILGFGKWLQALNEGKWKQADKLVAQAEIDLNNYMEASQRCRADAQNQSF